MNYSFLSPQALQKFFLIIFLLLNKKKYIKLSYPFFVTRFTTDHLVKSLTESMKLRNGSGGDPDGSFSRLTDCAVKPISNSRASQQQLGSGGGYTLGYTPQYGSNGNVVRTATDYRPPSYQQQNSPDPMGAVVKRPSPTQQQVRELCLSQTKGKQN